MGYRLTTLLIIGLVLTGSARAESALFAGAAIDPIPVSDVRYGITFTQAEAAERIISVETGFTVRNREPVLLSLPAWTPGYYRIRDFAGNVMGFSARAGSAELHWDKVDPDTWRVFPDRPGRVTIRFDYQADEFSCETSWTAPDFALITGTNLFLFPEGGDLEFPARVEVTTEPAWQVITGLEPGRRAGTWQAGSFHELVDCPFFIGRVEYDSREINGHEYRLASYPVDVLTGEAREQLWEALGRAVPPIEDVFGETPYDSYTVLLAFGEEYPGMAALEHRNSFLGVGVPDLATHPLLATVAVHEIFHAWNVKRLRPAEMVPYDYSRTQPTTLLWVSEGLTVYYTDLMLARGGAISSQEYYDLVLENINLVQDLPEVALEDASLSTWIEPVDGTHTIYYQKGALAGLLLDILIRDASDNRGSLDTVMKHLYDTTWRQGSGFTDEQFWNAASNAAEGIDLSDFAAEFIDGREAFPWAEIFPLAGLTLTADSTRVLSLGASLGVNTISGEILVNQVTPGRPLAEAGVQEGDVLVRIGDIELDGLDSFNRFRDRYASATEGDHLAMIVRRDEDELSLSLPLRFTFRVTPVIREIAGASEKARRIRAGLLGQNESLTPAGAAGRD